MRRFPILSRWLIALGFLAVQALAVACATDHELKADKAQTCEICMLAHAAGGTPAVIDTAALVVPRGSAPLLPAVSTIARRHAARPFSRGPPSA
jgi:hypothetical protein